MSRVRSLLVFLSALVGLRVLAGRATTQEARISFSLLDGLGTRGSMSLYAMLDPTKLISDLAQALIDLRALVGAVTNAGVVESRISLIDPTVTAANAASRLEQNALLQYAVPASGRTHGVAVPAISNANILSGRVDMTEGNAPDLLADAITGNVVSSVGPVTVGIWTSSDWLALGAILQAQLAFREHRRQLGRASRQIGPA